MTNIKFGTDGWRGIIADDFTFDNVRRVAGGIAAYVWAMRILLAASSSAMTLVFFRSRPPVSRLK